MAKRGDFLSNEWLSPAEARAEGHLGVSFLGGGSSELAATADDTGSSGGNETDLLTVGGIASDRGGVTNVLMVTTTVRMLDGVHRHTSHSGPVALLRVSLVVGVAGLQDGFVRSGTAGDDADHGSAATHNGLANAGRKSHSGLLAVLRVANDDGRAAGRASKHSTVAELGLNVGDNGALGHDINGEDVYDSQRCY